MANIEADNSRNEVQIDLDKYMKLVDKLDAAEDLIEKMKEDRARMKPGKRKFMDLFLDHNDINEKAIIGFISFFLMNSYIISPVAAAAVSM